jgi:hypothetical protein
MLVAPTIAAAVAVFLMNLRRVSPWLAAEAEFEFM